MDKRERKGLLLAHRDGIEYNDDDIIHFVPSESKPNHRYRVFFSENSTCNCEDFQRYRQTCKHIWAVHYFTIKDSGEELPEVPDEEEVETPVIQRNWPAYNRALVNEEPKLLLLLRDLCKRLTTPPPSRSGGRPRIPLSDMIFAMVYKVFSKDPARQFMNDLGKARESGFVRTQFNHNSLLNYFDDPDLTPTLLEMVGASAAPMAAQEQGEFAIDATGITTSRFRRWVQERDLPDKEKRDWVKLNLICGAKTKVVAAVEITEGSTNESPFLPRLVAEAAKQFRIVRVSADKQYSSINNLNAVHEIGATPLIPFKDNAVGEGDDIWRRAFFFFQYRKAEFTRHYNKRNIAECVFSMMKRKFADSVRSRKRTAMKNEILCKVICHNLCRIILSMYESNLEADFCRVSPTID